MRNNYLPIIICAMNQSKGTGHNLILIGYYKGRRNHLLGTIESYKKRKGFNEHFTIYCFINIKWLSQQIHYDWKCVKQNTSSDLILQCIALSSRYVYRMIMIVIMAPWSIGFVLLNITSTVPSRHIPIRYSFAPPKIKVTYQTIFGQNSA